MVVNLHFVFCILHFSFYLFQLSGTVEPHSYPVLDSNFSTGTKYDELLPRWNYTEPKNRHYFPARCLSIVDDPIVAGPRLIEQGEITFAVAKNNLLINFCVRCESKRRVLGFAF